MNGILSTLSFTESSSGANRKRLAPKAERVRQVLTLMKHSVSFGWWIYPAGISPRPEGTPISPRGAGCEFIISVSRMVYSLTGLLPTEAESHVWRSLQPVSG